MAMLSLLALIPLGDVEVCIYTDLTIGGPTEDCSGNVNTPQCHQAGDNEFDTCDDLGDGDYQKLTCSGDTITWAYHAKSDCSDAVSQTCVFVDLDPSKIVTSSCSIEYKFDECGTALSAMGMGVHMKFSGSCPGSDDPCFSREAEACRILDMSASPSDAFRACFDEPTLKVAERVPMPALSAGDYVLSTGKDLAYEFTRIIVNQHRVEDQVRPPPVPAIAHFPPMRSSRRAVPPNAAHARANPRPPDSNAPLWTLAAQKRSGVVKITHVNGELSLTPDHVLLVDGEWAAARTVKVGSSLSGSIVTAVSQGFGGIINPVTTNGMIVAAGPTGKPVVSAAYPEWIASYMLNVAVFPLPVSFSNLLSYLFPATVQAYYDQHLESFFAGNQAHLRAWKRDLPNVLIAPIIFAVDLLCAAGFVLYALASPKALAALAAVAVVARARRAKA